MDSRFAICETLGGVPGRNAVGNLDMPYRNWDWRSPILDGNGDPVSQEYVRTIRPSNAPSSLSDLDSIIEANPHQVWILGNEPTNPGQDGADFGLPIHGQDGYPGTPEYEAKWTDFIHAYADWIANYATYICNYSQDTYNKVIVGNVNAAFEGSGQLSINDWQDYYWNTYVYGGSAPWCLPFGNFIGGVHLYPRIRGPQEDEYAPWGVRSCIGPSDIQFIYNTFKAFCSVIPPTIVNVLATGYLQLIPSYASVTEFGVDHALGTTTNHNANAYTIKEWMTDVVWFLLRWNAAVSSGLTLDDYTPALQLPLLESFYCFSTNDEAEHYNPNPPYELQWGGHSGSLVNVDANGDYVSKTALGTMYKDWANGSMPEGLASMATTYDFG